MHVLDMTAIFLFITGGIVFYKKTKRRKELKLVVFSENSQMLKCAVLGCVPLLSTWLISTAMGNK